MDPKLQAIYDAYWDSPRRAADLERTIALLTRFLSSINPNASLEEAQDVARRSLDATGEERNEEPIQFPVNPPPDLSGRNQIPFDDVIASQPGLNKEGFQELSPSQSPLYPSGNAPPGFGSIQTATPGPAFGQPAHTPDQLLPVHSPDRINPTEVGRAKAAANFNSPFDDFGFAFNTALGQADLGKSKTDALRGQVGGFLNDFNAMVGNQLDIVGKRTKEATPLNFAKNIDFNAAYDRLSPQERGDNKAGLNRSARSLF